MSERDVDDQPTKSAPEPIQWRWMQEKVPASESSAPEPASAAGPPTTPYASWTSPVSSGGSSAPTSTIPEWKAALAPPPASQPSAGYGFGGGYGGGPSLSSDQMLRYVAGGLAILLVLAGVARLLVFPPSGGSRPLVSSEPRPTPQPFVPPTRLEGGGKVLSLLLPDGSLVELSYSGEPDLASLGVKPFMSAKLEGCCEKQLLIEQGDPALLYRTTDSGSTYPMAGGGSAAVYRAHDGPSQFLVLRFGDWTVGLETGAGPRALTDSQLAEWARSLGGHQTPEGYLVLDPKPPVSLVGAGTADGAGMEIGSIRRGGIIVSPRSCTMIGNVKPIGSAQVSVYRVGRGRSFAYWCLPELKAVVQVYGDDPFITSVLSTLKVTKVQLAG